MTSLVKFTGMTARIRSSKFFQVAAARGLRMRSVSGAHEHGVRQGSLLAQSWGRSGVKRGALG